MQGAYLKRERLQGERLKVEKLKRKRGRLESETRLHLNTNGPAHLAFSVASAQPAATCHGSHGWERTFERKNLLAFSWSIQQ